MVRIPIGLGYQQMFGATAFPTLGGWVPQPYLVNWALQPLLHQKKSHGMFLMAMTSLKCTKGLNATAVYFKGYDAQSGDQNFNTDELNLIANYTVPEGKLKGLGIQAMYIDVNFANPTKPDLQEYRVDNLYS